MKRPRSVNPFAFASMRLFPSWSDLWTLRTKARVPIVLGLIILCLTSALGTRFYNVPRLNVGAVAPETINAPADASIPDLAATQAKVNLARTQTREVLRLDQSTTVAARDSLQQFLDRGSELRQMAGPFPFAPVERLSLGSQSYVRRAPAAEWQILLASLPPLVPKPDAPKSGSQKSRPGSQTAAQTASAAKAVAPLPSSPAGASLQASLASEQPMPLARAVAELNQYRKTSSIGEVATLRQVMIEMRSRYGTALKSITAAPTHPAPESRPPAAKPVAKPTANSIAAAPDPANSATASDITAVDATDLDATNLTAIAVDKSALDEANLGADSSGKPQFTAAFLDVTETDWQQTKAQTPKIAHRMLTQGIPAGLPLELRREAITVQMQEDIPESTQPWVRQLLLATLQPNLVKDEEQTRQQQELSARDVQPEKITTRRGEIIVSRGEKISPSQFALLDHFRLSQRSLNWRGLLGFGGIVSGTIALYWFVERSFQSKMRRRDRLLILLLTLTTPLLIFLRVPATNLPAIGMLVGSFYGSPLGLTVTVLLAILLPTGMGVAMSGLLPSVLSGIVCGILAGRLRTREELALLGTAAGLVQGSAYLILGVATGGIWYRLLGDAAIQGLLGLAWSIVAIGSSPYLEHMFDLVTTVRLVELANPNRPLLKRLAAEAPGTFQHTLLVATLAEAAARALGCNVELVRTGTLYHDIGKMHDPQGFIENQMGGPNKHDLIDDPWKSADIIKKHVSEGLVMARRARLPKAVQAFIPEHQGTMLVAYFYHQAQQRSQTHSDPNCPAPVVNESDFRYAGPDPQSRETGLVMVADACEAALRSLKSATPDEALIMINKILRARWQDQQLAGSGLTRGDMDTIAQVFVQTWQQFNHQRIAYPKLSSSR